VFNYIQNSFRFNVKFTPPVFLSQEKYTTQPYSSTLCQQRSRDAAAPGTPKSQRTYFCAYCKFYLFCGKSRSVEFGREKPPRKAAGAPFGGLVITSTSLVVWVNFLPNDSSRRRRFRNAKRERLGIATSEANHVAIQVARPWGMNHRSGNHSRKRLLFAHTCHPYLRRTFSSEGV